MTDALQNINITYSPIEDRLLMSVAGSAGSAQRIWLSRRFTIGLWRGLTTLLGQFPGAGAVVAAEARDAVLAMRHQETIADGRVKVTEQKPAENEDAGEDVCASLAVKAAFGRVRNDVGTLTLTTREHAITLALDERTLHALCQMLITATENAGWGLSLRVGDGNIAAPGARVH